MAAIDSRYHLQEMRRDYSPKSLYLILRKVLYRSLQVGKCLEKLCVGICCQKNIKNECSIFDKSTYLSPNVSSIFRCVLSIMCSAI